VFRSDFNFNSVRIPPLKDLIARLALTGGRNNEIYRTEDSFGPVVVREQNGLRILSFDSHFEQSVMRLDNPLALVHEYTRVMLLVLLFKESEQITLLGLGGGSLLRVLHTYCTKANFQVVELRRSVIRIALDHFRIPSDERIVMHNRNGIDYIREAKRHSSDIVFADMYQAYSMEEFQNTIRFLEQSWQLLTADGWLVINFHHLPESEHPYMERMCALFPEVLCCATKGGNYVVMCGKQTLAQPLPDYRDSLAELEQRFDVRLYTSFARMFKLSTPATDSARLGRRSGLDAR
jgi:spermidine synthase